MTELSKATHIDVEAGVRYWDDACVNGVDDDENQPAIFGADGDMWRVRINLADGRIEGWPDDTVAVIHYKVCDAGEYWLLDADGARIAKWGGYCVPNDYLCHGAQGFGDYIIMKVKEGGFIEDYAEPDLDADRWKPTP